MTRIISDTVFGTATGGRAQQSFSDLGFRLALIPGKKDSSPPSHCQPQVSHRVIIEVQDERRVCCICHSRRQQGFGETACKQVTQRWIHGQSNIVSRLVGFLVDVCRRGIVRERLFRQEGDCLELRSASHNFLRPERI